MMWQNDFENTVLFFKIAAEEIDWKTPGESRNVKLSENAGYTRIQTFKLAERVEERTPVWVFDFSCATMGRGIYYIHVIVAWHITCALATSRYVRGRGRARHVFARLAGTFRALLRRSTPSKIDTQNACWMVVQEWGRNLLPSSLASKPSTLFVIIFFLFCLS